MLDNYLAAEELIKARLAEKLSEVPALNILSAADLDGVKEASQVTPAVHVMYFDDEVPGSDGDAALKSRHQKTQQLWAVILVVRNVRDKTGQASREDAGLLISTLLDTLQGWKPSAEHGPLRRRKAPFRTTYRNGFAYFPFLFSTQIVTTGSAA
jgi:hypothetical protein